MFKVILISGKAGVGKTTTAHMIMDVLRTKPCMYSPFATSLKSISKEVFGWNGEKDDKGRSLLINLARVIRDYDIDFWARLVYDLAEKTLADVNFDYLIVDDWRYLNEMDVAISRYGLENVLTIRVERPDGEILKGTRQYNDPSETSLPSADSIGGVMYKWVIYNNGTLDDLRQKIEYVIS